MYGLIGIHEHNEPKLGELANSDVIIAVELDDMREGARGDVGAVQRSGCPGELPWVRELHQGNVMSETKTGIEWAQWVPGVLSSYSFPERHLNVVYSYYIRGGSLRFRLVQNNDVHSGSYYQEEEDFTLFVDCPR